MYSSAKRLVEDQLVSLPDDIEAQQLPNPDNIARYVNYHRQKLRPPHPTDLTFEVSGIFIADTVICCLN